MINKKFGQNFLINSGVVDTIIKNAEIEKKDLVIEIGCGLGSLTHRILEKECTLFGFEIDRAYIDHLKKIFIDNKNFNLIEGDFLKTIKNFQDKTDLSPFGKIIILGNLPYNITTPILEKIFTGKIKFDSLIFMVQKEVGERIVSGPGTKKYGSLSIFCQYYTDPAIICRISPGSFFPKPNVDSILIHFKKKEISYKPDNETLFFKVVRSLFISRRKQIKNNLILSPFLKNYSEESLTKALINSGIPLTVRGETLSIDEVIKFSNELNKFPTISF